MRNSMHKLSVVIPCYNEKDTLAAVVSEVLALKSSELAIEVVIVDDCSKDESLQIARQIEQQEPAVKVLSHAVNQGKGAALRTGFLAVTGDFVCVQDADLEYDPKDYLQMLVPMLAGGGQMLSSALVICSNMSGASCGGGIR